MKIKRFRLNISGKEYQEINKIIKEFKNQYKLDLNYKDAFRVYVLRQSKRMKKKSGIDENIFKAF